MSPVASTRPLETALFAVGQGILRASEACARGGSDAPTLALDAESGLIGDLAGHALVCRRICLRGQSRLADEGALRCQPCAPAARMANHQSVADETLWTMRR